MQRKKIDVDIVRNILVLCSKAFPLSGFIAGLPHQYDNPGTAICSNTGSRLITISFVLAR